VQDDVAATRSKIGALLQQVVAGHGAVCGVGVGQHQLVQLEVAQTAAETGGDIL